MPGLWGRGIWVVVACALGFGAAVAAHASELPTTDKPVEFAADEVSYDKDNGIVTARGKVEVTQGNRILLADQIQYDQKGDKILAEGHISLLEPTGEVMFAKSMALSGDLKNAVIRNLRIILADGARVAAKQATRSEGRYTRMDRAVYSPCEPCVEDPSRSPLWQVKAVKVTHDQEEKTIYYKHAWIELAGIPIIYTPYISHPDPTVKRETGFLAPGIGSSGDLGIVAKTPFFWAINDQMDMTLTPGYASNEGPLLAAEYRQRLEKGRIDGTASVALDQDHDVQAHIKSKSRFDIDRTWRWGLDLERTTDDTYMRRYEYGSDSVLTSEAFAEGFRGRNYMSARAMAFQGLAVEDDAESTPYVAPMFQFSHVGKPNRVGARTGIDASMVALTRTNGTDSRRLSVRGEWQVPYIGPMGDVYKMTASVRGDLYHLNGVAEPGKDGSTNGAAYRIFPELTFDWRYPFIQAGKNSYQMLEPIVVASISPYGGNPSSIPNEDSLDIAFDDTNLFASNRFAGHDRVEGGPKVSYGLRWSIFHKQAGTATAIFGQSIRAKENRDFPTGSGLEDQLSDVVGRVNLAPSQYLNLYYRTRLSKDNLAARRNELNMTAGVKALNLGVNYASFARHEEDELPSREELTLSLNSQMTRFWRSTLSATQDLTDDGGLLSAGLGLTYEDECFIFDTQFARRFFRDRDLEPSDSVFFRMTLKTLGEVQAQAY